MRLEKTRQPLSGIKPARLLLALLLAGWFLNPGPARATDYDRPRVINIQAENDLFGGGTDRHYTHGTRISYLIKLKGDLPAGQRSRFDRQAEKMADRLVANLPLLAGRTNLIGNRTRRINFILGQNIFTPENITVKELQPAEQPYGGWSYVGLGLVTVNDKDASGHWLENLELDLGVVGPASKAEEAQREWHRLIGVELPQGWDHQLKDEFGVLLNYEVKKVVPVLGKSGGLALDVSPSLGLALGNIYTYVSSGATLRLGRDLPRDYGPPRIRPALQGSGFFKGGSKPACYLFVGVEARAMGRNIFLDGNTWKNSHNVDKKRLVGDLQAGLVVSWGRFRGSFTNVFRTREYYGQKEKDEFGSINLSILF